MMTKEEAQKAIDGVCELAREVMQQLKDHRPTMVCFTPEGHGMLDLGPLMNMAERLYAEGRVDAGYGVKDVMAKVMKTHLKNVGAFGAIFVSEVWMLKAKRGDIQVMGGDEPGKAKVKGPLPRFAPDREEGLTVQWEFKLDGQPKWVGARTWVITRGENDSVSYGPVMETEEHLPGRLSNLIE